MSEVLAKIQDTVADVEKQIAILPDGAASKLPLQTLLTSLMAMSMLAKEQEARFCQLEARLDEARA